MRSIVRQPPTVSRGIMLGAFHFDGISRTQIRPTLTRGLYPQAVRPDVLSTVFEEIRYAAVWLGTIGLAVWCTRCKVPVSRVGLS